jgi:hypothetical protein
MNQVHCAEIPLCCLDRSVPSSITICACSRPSGRLRDLWGSEGGLRPESRAVLSLLTANTTLGSQHLARSPHFHYVGGLEKAETFPNLVVAGLLPLFHTVMNQVLLERGGSGSARKKLRMRKIVWLTRSPPNECKLRLRTDSQPVPTYQ